LLGGSITFFALAGSGQAVLVLWEIIPSPITASIFYLGFIAVMAYEMSREALRATQLAEDLCESEERMSMAAEAAGVGVWVWRIKHNRVWGSERWLDLFGFPSGAAVSFEEVIQRIHPDDCEMVRRQVERALAATAGYQAEFRVPLLDGSQRWIASRGRVYLDARGKPARMLGAAIEITERKRTEEGFRQVVEASPNGIVLVNREGRILLVNAETEKIFGYPREELIGHSVEMLVPERFRDGHPSHRTGFFAAPHACTLSAKRELFALRRDGTDFPVDIGLRPIQSADGVQVLVSILDITARKRAEAETLRQREELTHVARVSTMGHLASSLAHELNQPLGAILRNAEAAELFLKEPVPDLDEVRAILADIRQDDQRAGEVIDRVRALMKRRQVQRSLIMPSVLMGEVIALVRPDAEMRRVRLALEVGTTLPPIHGDRVQLQQVLLNLLLNAMDALNDNPPASRLVAVRTRQAGATVEFAVRDNGHGIAPDKLSSVFEPFFTSKPNGLGMGLSISRSIIEAHGGRLWAENDAAGGAIFIFTLPTATGGDAK
jgi:PAS domain S-box-containing protein